MHEARLKVVLLLFLGAAHMLVDPVVFSATAFVAIIVLTVQWAHFQRFIPLFGVLLAATAAVGGVVWAAASADDARRVTLGLLRLVSLSAVTLAIASSLSVLDLAAVARWLRLPMGVAIALAVCVRFVPVLLVELRQTAYIRRQRGQSLAWGIRRFGIAGAVSRLTSPIMIGTLRRVDAIVLAVHLQDLPGRIRRYGLVAPSILDWFLLAMCTGTIGAALTWRVL